MIATVLLIDDEEGLRKLIARIISLEGFVIEEAATLKSGAHLLNRKKIDVVLCDVKLPDGSGVDFVKEYKAKFPQIEFILLTAYGNIPDGVQAIKNGAFDYLTKGNDNDRLLPLLQQALEKVKQGTKTAVTITDKNKYNFDAIIGKSVVFQETIRLAKKIAQSTANVLLLGETGTGKEVFANAIHENSNRSAKPFVAINCSAFAKELLEGELFGHLAGAYTGAVKDKKGLIELADGGTLFLDEIGDMNIDLQAKLLRVLENGEFIKLGDVKTTKVSVRIIAATNRNLQAEVAEGQFREDLFYRLNTFTILLPPLRDRKEDIEELAVYFLQQFAQREGKVFQFTIQALQALERHVWKGNIRELRNVVERAVILAEGHLINLCDLPSDIQKPGTSASNFALTEVEKEHIRKILHYTKNNKSKTAQLLGIGIATLYRKLEEYNLPK